MKKKINVTRKEFQDSYRRHYKLYRNSSGSEKTRRLILFYSVECGLKCLIMKQTGNNTYEDLENYCNSIGKSNLAGHNIKEMMKELNPQNDFVLKSIHLTRGGSAAPAQFNQLWRYGVDAENEEEEKAEATLIKIAEWIQSRL